MTVFTWLARGISRRPIAVIASWTVLTVGFGGLALIGVGQGGLFQRVELGAPTVPGSDSDVASGYSLDQAHPGAAPRLTTAVVGISPLDDRAAAAFAPAFSSIAATPGVAVIVSPLGIVPGVDALKYDPGDGTLDPASLVAADGNGFVIIVEFVDLDSESDAYRAHSAAEQALDRAVDSLSTSDPGITTHSFSVPLLVHDYEVLVKHDLLRGEAVALPLALIVMVLVFGGFLAASTPIAGALASIAAGLAALFALSYPMSMSSAAINVVSILGVGLSIDYGLLIVSRYREELARLGPNPDSNARAGALERTLTTAGRTIFFSGLIVTLSVGSMLAFDLQLMKGFGAAGIAIVFFALLTALTLVPALLAVFGNRLTQTRLLERIPGFRRVLKATADVTNDEGPLSKLAGWIQKRPWFTLGSAVAVLLILASPVLAFVPRNSEVELLPAGFERRAFVEVVSSHFPDLAEPDILIVAEASTSELDAWLDDARTVEGVLVATPAQTRNGMTVAGISILDPDPGGAEAADVVHRLRDLDAPFQVYVGGQAAVMIDFAQAILANGLIALGFILLAVVALVFLMTGSIVMPIKALLVNSLSIAATIGILVWMFQYGNLSGPLGFDPPGGIEIYVLIALVCFGFGLAMDYELFLLSRIKELVDGGMSNDEAVRIGLQRSGRIITSAAAVIILVFVGFAFGDLLVIKEVGFGLAFAVLIDATIVRLLVVPATMTLLGKWNWWAPRPLRRLHEKVHIVH